MTIQQSLTLDLEPNVHFFACDVTDPSAVYSTADRIHSSVGCPSILINNAGILQCRTIFDTSDEWLRKIYDVNLISNFYTVKAFVPHMVKKNKGHIVTVASTASYVGVGGMADYCSTKAGVLSFHEGLLPSPVFTQACRFANECSTQPRAATPLQSP
jgi:NAD(P)-dependent dehydrogenase (short-subunit alcohol dehydrogenase family)